MARKLDTRIEIRLSADDKRSCELRAKAVGLDLSAWIRHRLLLDKRLTPKPAPVAARSEPKDSDCASTSP